MQNKRRNKRVQIKDCMEIEIDMHSESNFYTGFVTNISSGGLFIATYEPESVGIKIPIRFSLPNYDAKINTVGEVRWRREFNPWYPRTQPGMGLKFIDLQHKDKQVINEYLSAYRDPYFYPEEELIRE